MKSFTILLLAIVASTACSKSKGESTPIESTAKGYATGRLTDGSGNPLAGAQVIASHNTYYNTTASATTDENGYYKLNLSNPKGNWSINAEIKRTYNGKHYRFDVYSDNSTSITHEGGVRNFIWKLTGHLPGAQSDIKVGGYITYMDDNSVVVPENEIEFTLIPQGNLVDGTSGQTINKRAEHFPETYNYMFSSSGLRDVPVGRYKISARHIPPAGTPKPLLLSIRYSGTFSESVIADFEQEDAQTWQEIALFTKHQ